MATSSAAEHGSLHPSGRGWRRGTNGLQDTVARIHQLRDSLQDRVLCITVADNHEKVLEAGDVMRNDLRNMFANLFLLFKSQYLKTKWKAACLPGPVR